MKKQLSFLLASIMFLSVFVLPTQVSAATVAELRGNSAYAVAEDTILFEYGVGGEQGVVRQARGATSALATNADGDQIYVTDGQYLHVKVEDHVYAGTKLFSIELEGAKFLFRNADTFLSQSKYAQTYGQVGHDAFTNHGYSNIETISSLLSVVGSNALEIMSDAAASGTLLPNNQRVAGYQDSLGGTDIPGRTYLESRGAYFGPTGSNPLYYEETYFRYPQGSLSTRMVNDYYSSINDPMPAVNETPNAASYYLDPGATLSYEDAYPGRGLYVYDVLSKLALEMLLMDIEAGQPIIELYDVNENLVAFTNFNWSYSGSLPNRSDLLTDSNYRGGIESYYTQFRNAIEDSTLTRDGNEIPYELHIEYGYSSARASVYVSPIRSPFTGKIIQNSYDYYDTSGGGSNNDLRIRVPLALIATANDVRARISDTNISLVHSNVYLIGTTVGSGTTTTVFDNFVLRNSAGGSLRVRENRAGSISGTGTVTLTAPTGWYFEKPTASKDPNFGLTLQGGLTWNTPGRRWNGTTGKYVLSDAAFSVRYGSTKEWNGSAWVDKLDQDPTKLEIVLSSDVSINQSTSIVGTLLIEGVKLVPYEYAQFTNVLIGISGSSGFGITAKSDIDLGSRPDWNVLFSAATPVKELISGRYDPAAPTATIHQASDVTIHEQAANAWWAARETVMTLDEVAKFRAVQIREIENISPDIKGTYYADEAYGQNRSGNVYLEPNKLTLYNLTITANKRGKVVLRPYISIRADYTGEVKMHFQNSTEATVTNQGVLSAVIANATSPIIVSAESTDIKIGYQTLNVKDITIEEAKTGLLLEGTQILVSISDQITQDLYFANVNPAADIEYTNIELRNIANINQNSVTNNGGIFQYGTSGYNVAPLLLGGGTIAMEVGRRSIAAPAKITLKNLLVKVSRDVPQSVINYKAIVWGTAVASNYGGKKDQFSAVPGIMKDDYVKVVSAANDRTSVLSQEVTISLGDNYCVVNGEIKDFLEFDVMDTVAYISPATQAFMIPLRFISYAFGISMDQILWDDSAKTATIIHPTRIVQFTANSERMMLNGAPVTMDYTHLGAGIYKAEIETNSSRMFVPFRAVGEAFGVNVEWIAETSTAVFRPATDPMTQH